MVHKILPAILFTAALSVPANAAEVMAPEGLIDKGHLTYGVAATYAPFEFKEKGVLKGFDIDLIGLITAKMGLKTKAMNMEFKGLIPALQGKRIDIINSAMYIKPKRAEVVDFVPYMKVGNQLVVAAGNPKNIMSPTDFCGLTVAVTLGGFQESLAKEQSADCTAKGKKPAKVLTFPTAQDSALALKRGRADAIINSTAGAVIQVKALPDSYAIGGKTFGPYFLVGLAVRKGDSNMHAALSKALAAIQADGSFDKLIVKYKFPEEAKNIK